MRNLFDGSRRGRRPERLGSIPVGSSPYDFGTADDDERVDPVDLMAIRADDQLLDALAVGGAFGEYGSVGLHAADPGGGFRDDQEMLAMLAAWRSEVWDEPVPELLTTEQASEAIVSGQRAAHPRRRLMPVAAAAAAVVLGMSGVAIGASSAEPGDALWGVSKTLDGDRAESKEAAQRVSVALASVRQALDEGRVTDAQATLVAIAPELDKVTDAETKRELSSRQANLTETAGDAEEGERVATDESGKRKRGDREPDRKSDRSQDKGGRDEKDHSGTGRPDPKSGEPAKGGEQRSRSGSPEPDPRRSGKPAESSSAARPAPDSSAKPAPSKPSESRNPEHSKPESAEPAQPKDKSRTNGEGEGEGTPEASSSAPATPNAMTPPGPPAAAPAG